MFFVGGVSSKEKKLDFSQTIVCPNCGSVYSIDNVLGDKIAGGLSVLPKVC